MTASMLDDAGLRARKARSALATGFIVLSFVVMLVPLVMIVGYVVSRGAKVISWSFLTGDLPIIDRIQGGIGPAIVGTLLITGAATLMAVPLGILGGIYLNEYGGRRRTARVVRFLADVLTGVPSIVMGLFVYAIWTLRFKNLSAFGGALALACLMLPIVIRTTEEVLRLVPADQREASYALGGRKATTIRRVVMPSAVPGVTSGALLAIARAAGETAPLLFTIGAVTSTNTSLFHGSNTALSVLIFRNATSPFVVAQDRAWGAALTLIVIVFVFTLLARVVSARFDRRRHA
ncbi:MAG TPA: phosphate ABC transporter permease PstA [Acidimicrobiia bacterium]|nr:phosphate ABC transporter permease PstA [Acidimicrobiia bacterium]